MTRHTLYLVTGSGRVRRAPLLSAETHVVRRYLANNPDLRFQVIPPLPDETRDEAVARLAARLEDFPADSVEARRIRANLDAIGTDGTDGEADK